MAFPWLVIVAAIASVALSLIFMPRPKAPKPAEMEDLENPTAEAGRPFPVVFGTITVKGLNNLGYFEKSVRTKKVAA